MKAPDRAGPYLILREIGSGGMGAVYLALETGKARRTVAVKFMKPEIRSKITIARFLRERDILAGLHHPNIVRLLGSGDTSDGSPYIAMEWIPGDGLQTAARNLTARLGVFSKNCGAVSHCHARGIIHRDLKPGNILIAPDGSPKLIDFGISKYLDTEPESVPGAYALFTPEYASPELLGGSAVSERSDIYALGVILFELLAPWRHSLHPLCAALLDVVAKAIGNDPASRQCSVDELAGDLAAVIAKFNSHRDDSMEAIAA